MTCQAWLCPSCLLLRSVLLVPGTLDTGRHCWWVETDFPEGVPPEARCVTCLDMGKATRCVQSPPNALKPQKSYPAANCARRGCWKAFLLKRPWGKYCSAKCRAAAHHAKRKDAR